MIPPGIEIWAQTGIAIEYVQAERLDAAKEWSLVEVAAFVRAAYGRGYVAALTDEPPLTILEAGRRRDALAIALPV